MKEIVVRSDGGRGGRRFLPLLGAGAYLAVAAAAGFAWGGAEPELAAAVLAVGFAGCAMVAAGLAVRAGRLERRAREHGHAASADDGKSRVLATVSHELRTPMSGILGMTDLLLHTRLSAEQTSYTRTIRAQASSLLGLVEEVLDVARIEAGGLHLSAEPFAPRALVTEVAELLAPRAEEKGLEIAVFVARQVPAALRGDADRLRQVLVNLVGNGIKFSRRGGVLIEMVPAAGPRVDADDSVAVEITVRDTGIGIPADQTGRIFEEFRQAGSGPARREGGAGLGLAICRRLVRAMGGEIDVHSTPGRGSAFTVRLGLPVADPARAPQSLAGMNVLVASPSPVVRRALTLALRDEGARPAAVARADALLRRTGGATAHDAVLVDLSLAGGDAPAGVSIVLVPPAERAVLDELPGRGFAGYLIKPVRRESLIARIAMLRPGPAASGRRPRRGALPAHSRRLRLLLAEDDDVNAMLATAMLERYGHEVVRVGDGEAALAALARTPRSFDLVLMDVQMPGLDGLSATRRLRRREAEGAASARRLPVVALTANTAAGDRGACLEAGMDGVLAKPVSAGDLLACLDAHCTPPGVGDPAPRPLARRF